MKKYKVLTVILLCITLSLFSACSNQSVEDAAKRAEQNPWAKTPERDTKPRQEGTQVSENHETQGFDGNDEGSKVNVANMNETIRYGDFEFCVEDVLLSDNLDGLEEIGGNPQLKAFMIHDMGNLDDSGAFVGNSNSWMLVKVKMKYMGTAKEIEKCMAPAFYNNDGKNQFSYISKAETRGFDQYKNIQDLTKLHKDAYYYTFTQGEEIETVLAIQIMKSPITFRDVYLSTKFLLPNAASSSSYNPPGCYMIKLNMIDGEIVE